MDDSDESTTEAGLLLFGVLKLAVQEAESQLKLNHVIGTTKVQNKVTGSTSQQQTPTLNAQ